MPDLTGNSDAGNLPLRLLLSSLTGSVTLKVPETSQSLGWLTVPAARGGQLGNVAQVARGRAGPAVAPGDPADRAACRPLSLSALASLSGRCTFNGKFKVYR